MPDVVLLSLGDGTATQGCVSAGQAPVRVPVRACVDALRAAGAEVELAVAASDAEVDAAVKPAEVGDARLVVAAATDAEVRAIVRRMVRHFAPPPSKRPAELPAGRTVFDLPPLAVLPLAPAVPGLVTRLGLPTAPADVARAVLAGPVRRLDLLRHDGGSITLGGCLLGGADPTGHVLPWRARVEVDDAVLTDGSQPLVACGIQIAGSSNVDDLPLVDDVPADDGLVHVAVAVPVRRPRRLRGPAVGFEVRRARGRAVSVNPRDGQVATADDGVAGELSHRRSWWVEPSCWAVYLSPSA
jgi:hypothetical protein